MPDEPDQRRMFEQCIDQLGPAMYRVAFRLTGCASTAGDLVQESFVQAWQGLESLNDLRKMRSWMFSILRNQHCKQLRRTTRERTAESAVFSGLPAPAGSSRHEEQELLQFALDRLDDGHKLPLLLNVMEDLSVEEIAESMDLPPGTVMSRLHRGRKKLKAIIDRQLRTNT